MKKNIWFIFFLIALSGCNGQYVKPTTTHSESIQPAFTQSIIQSTPTTPPTPTQLLPRITQECIEITNAPTHNQQGVVVLKKDWQSRLTFQDAGKQHFVPADPDMQVPNYFFSPDQKWLIYELSWRYTDEESKFILTKADGLQVKEMSWREFPDWSNRFWLNNQAFRVVDADVATQSIQVFSFDPFSETKSILRLAFPGVVSRDDIDWHIDTQAVSIGQVRGTNILYDPTLARVLYPQNDNVVSLYNLETNTEIAKTAIPGWGKLPKWSSDGKNLTIIGTMSASPERESLDEFLIVSRDGPEFKRLSYLTSVFKSVRIEEYSWSPNGQRIAFWLKTEKTTSDNSANPFELAVLDIQTGQITTHCLTGITAIEFDTYSRNANITWSPDGTQLLIARYISQDKKKFDVVLVDLTNKIAYKVAENMYQIGWMTKEP